MFFKKVYGQSRTENCPFCEKKAVASNEQGVPVCVAHKTNSLPDMKCACGEYLDIRAGKFGVFFNCLECGNISYAKATEINAHKLKALPGDVSYKEVGKAALPAHLPEKDESGKWSKENFYHKYTDRPQKTGSGKPSERKEITIRSDELDFI